MGQGVGLGIGSKGCSLLCDCKYNLACIPLPILWAALCPIYRIVVLWLSMFRWGRFNFDDHGDQRVAFTILSNVSAFNLQILLFCYFLVLRIIFYCIFQRSAKVADLSFWILIFFHLMVKFQVLMPSINRITQFFSSKEAVSRDVALQTAAALQVYITVFMIRMLKITWLLANK